MQNIADSKIMAHQLLDLASVVRSKGPLSLQEYTSQMAQDPFLLRAMNLVSDGAGAEDIDRLLGQEIESVTARHEHSAGMLKRASEVAPAMGLIGTLVGLVQMLAALDDPASIGPSMAVALLTTFYGALMGTVLLSPLAAKLERRSEDEFVIKTMVLLAAMSMSRKENPRRLEMLLNTTLPPEKRIRYFK
jgi:chemotaxis protein MotA